MQYSPEAFAAHEYQDYVIFHELAESEPNKEFREILEGLAAKEWRDYQNWLTLSGVKTFAAERGPVLVAKLLRKVFGLTFIARYLKRHEESTIHELEAILADAPADLRERIRDSIAHERANEEELLAKIKEEKVQFTSSIILGLNDGLIELTGALVGFSFALGTTRLVALTGAITGIAATLSMASSAYMQARHDPSGKDPKKAAFYTGLSYFIVLILLLAPFVVQHNVRIGLVAMFITIFVIVAAISYYTAVIFERNFRSQFGQMVFFSLGVAAVALFIGTLFRHATGVSI